MMFIMMRRISPSGILLGLAAIVLATLVGCSFQPLHLPEDAAAREAIINPPRGRMGNPAVYEVHGTRYFVLETSVG